MADKKTKQRGLGRGLSALMADVSDATTDDGIKVAKADQSVAIELVHPNPNQPRRVFDKDKLEELANSIREKGIVQPLIVRTHRSGNGQFEIVAGERRWRAAQLANLHQVPVIVREFDDTEVLEIAIIENIQRADLNPVEEAAGYLQLMEKFGHTQEKLAQALGKSRSHVANLTRLLQLPISVRDMISDGRLSAGHARALITADDPEALAHRVVKQGLSVRQTEQLVKSSVSNVFTDSGKTKAGKSPEKDADTRALEGDISANLGMKVQIDHSGSGEAGRLSISYKSLDELDNLCNILSGARSGGSK